MTSFSSPVEVGSRRTSAYGMRNGILHAGDDYAPREVGDHDPIYAAADGKCIAAGVGVLAGHTGGIVVLDHGELTGNGTTDRTLTNYGHMSKIVARKGATYKAGDLIGYMGATGNATGVHLHAGVRFNGKWASFDKWMKSKGIDVTKTAPRKASAKLHKVKAGETLSGIAAKHGKDWRKIAKLNGISRPYTIYVNQEIKLG